MLLQLLFVLLFQLIASGDVVIIDMTLNSEDFCTAVNVNIDITGTLGAYQSMNYINLKESFGMRETAYFKVKVSSPKATLSSVTLERIQLVLPFNQNETQVLVDNRVLTEFGKKYEMLTDSNYADYALFSFNMTSFPINGDDFKDFKVSATVSVKYAAIQSDISSDVTLKYDALPNEEQIHKFENQIKVSTRSTGERNSANSKHSSIWISIFLCSLYLLIYV
jgi:hypothetical protein